MNLTDFKLVKNRFFQSLIIWLLMIITTFPEKNPFLIEKTSPNWKNSNPTSAEILQRQIEKPNLIIDDFGGAQAGKRQFRLLIPMLGYLTNLDVTDFILIQALLGLVFIYYLIFVLSAQFKFSGYDSFLTTICLSQTYFIQSSILDIWPFFDFIAYFAMTIILFSQNKLIIFILFLAAYFIDERALLGSIGVLLGSFVIENKDNIKLKNILNMKFYIFVFSVLVYFLIRIILVRYFNFKTNTGQLLRGKLAIFETWKWFKIAFVTTYKSFIFIIPVFLIYFEQQFKKPRNYFIYIIIISIFYIIIYSFLSLFVYDLTKSLTYLFPLIFSLFILFVKCQIRYDKRLIINIMLVVNLLIPTMSITGPVKYVTRSLIERFLF